MKIDTTLPILIVDDNVQYTQLLRRILESGFGFNNITAVTAPKEARELIDADPGRFRMLFVDYNFSAGTTGGELLQDLKKENLLQDKAAFLITSEPSLRNVEQASNAGALGVVVKPFNRSDLEQKIKKALRHLDDSSQEF